MRNYQILIKDKLEYTLLVQQIRAKATFDRYDIWRITDLGILVDTRRLFFLLNKGINNSENFIKAINQFKDSCDTCPSLTRYRIRKEQKLKVKIWFRRLLIKFFKGK